MVCFVDIVLVKIVTHSINTLFRFSVEKILIKDIRPGMQNITATFIILEVGSAIVTKENREVRTLLVADQSASINFSVWDEPSKLLAPGDIVHLTKGYASVWRSCLMLYSGKNGTVHRIGEFCMNFNEKLNMSAPNAFLQTNSGVTKIKSNVKQGIITNKSSQMRGTASVIQPRNVGDIQPTSGMRQITGSLSSSSSNTGRNDSKENYRNDRR